ncbi:hypothetical protein IEO21_04594 [Rhodonia placenta]|nr:hypothetical protein IEO21_04594 [Postia placenta]
MQLVSPAATQVMRPQALESALARPLIASVNEPQRPAAHLAAQLSHSIITERPFLHGNKRTGNLQAAFFLANEYIRARGTPGLADEGKVGVVYAHVA